ncbi:hypothetical protein SAMN04487949_3154 [Halogranum gelatinilyticum]|uniref:DUF7573 domain-containing protein n=1 Tax=Halogranum gelatinilyticum TaxID=660521 RepID=A0A1G9XW29_9EURY|nr:hypothetical protein [Halogranum gelatinilyticum]SDN01052.1 hypothetical protein SAMN04487949_3154 [Halogranum gelatinilyticum]
MSRDSSLGDFVGGDASESPTAEADEEPGRAEDPKSQEGESDGTVETDTVDPATPTYRFDPDGAACDECGESVEKRWHDDGQFVCADCKDW